MLLNEDDESIDALSSYQFDFAQITKRKRWSFNLVCPLFFDATVFRLSWSLEAATHFGERAIA